VAALARGQNAILRVRATLISALRNYFDSRGFVLVERPIFTPNACEGTTTLFETQYFDQKAYLTQSGQLYMEAAAMAFGKVYSFGPTFRAEKSKTRRHLIEFWMLEPEMAYATLDDVMALEEDMLENVVGRVLEERKEELKRIERDTTRLEQVKKPFHRLHYDEAVKMLARRACRSSGAATSVAPTRPRSPSRSIVPSSSITSRPRSRRSTWSSTRRRRSIRSRSTASRPRATARSRRGTALGRPRLPRGPRSTPTACPRGVRVVPGPAPLRLGAARRLRHRRRAHAGLDLRPRARARDHPVPAPAQPPRTLIHNADNTFAPGGSGSP
jgi:hypothetical protein